MEIYIILGHIYNHDVDYATIGEFAVHKTLEGAKKELKVIHKEILKEIEENENEIDFENVSEEEIYIGYNGHCIEEFKIEKRTIQE